MIVAGHGRHAARPLPTPRLSTRPSMASAGSPSTLAAAEPPAGWPRPSPSGSRCRRAHCSSASATACGSTIHLLPGEPRALLHEEGVAKLPTQSNQPPRPDPAGGRRSSAPLTSSRRRRTSRGSCASAHTQSESRLWRLGGQARCAHGRRGRGPGRSARARRQLGVPLPLCHDAMRRSRLDARRRSVARARRELLLGSTQAGLGTLMGPLELPEPTHRGGTLTVHLRSVQLMSRAVVTSLSPHVFDAR